MTDPIPVSEAIAALEREIESLRTWTKWDGPTADHYKRYRGTLEYIWGNLTRFGSDLLMEGDYLYAAVAPIVARFREEDKR